MRGYRWRLPLFSSLLATVGCAFTLPLDKSTYAFRSTLFSYGGVQLMDQHLETLLREILTRQTMEED